MKHTWLSSLVVLVLAIMMSTGIASAADPAITNSSVENQVIIPDNVKNLDDLVDYLKSKGIIKTHDDIINYMKTNKAVIKKLTPDLIDYGYTFRLYSETSTPLRDDGLIKITHDYGIKEAKLWVVPVIVTNNSDQKVEISKENFALVPTNIPLGSESSVLAIEPEYIMDGSKEAPDRKILGKFELPPGQEVHLNAVFYVYPLTSENSVNLRVYDGKDHTDVNIVKNDK